VPKHDTVALDLPNLSPAIAALIALLPSTLALWWGRRIARFVDDPVLPERLLANRSRNTAVAVAAFLSLAWAAVDHLAWALPLLIVTRMAAGYPLRRAVHRETWSLRGYMSFSASSSLPRLASGLSSLRCRPDDARRVSRLDTRRRSRHHPCRVGEVAAVFCRSFARPVGPCPRLAFRADGKQACGRE
jgi:hypothetical protein